MQCEFSIRWLDLRSSSLAHARKICEMTVLLYYAHRRSVKHWAYLLNTIQNRRIFNGAALEVDGFHITKDKPYLLIGFLGEFEFLCSQKIQQCPALHRERYIGFQVHKL